VIKSGTWTWFARHELRLAWRDWLSMLTAGHRGRERTAAIVLLVFIVMLHLIALAMVAPYARVGDDISKVSLIAITSGAVLSFSLMLSQAMESVTRAFYARADLDLILSSPIDARKIFCVRIGTTATSISLMALLLAAPFINVLALRGGAQWFAAYGVVIAMGVAATAVAVALTIALFNTIGPKRTRLGAQIVAAVIGAAFVIGLQIAAIQYYGTLSRFAVLESNTVVAYAPDVTSIAWWPARAILGDVTPLAAVLGLSFIALGGSVAAFSPRFADHAIAAAGVSNNAPRQARGALHFRWRSPGRALRAKEFALLRRDPWLLSQTLMQMLYLLPPALMLWHSFGAGTGPLVLMIPILVMASGQLAGGLAWLAISGEDAPDLVATAPVAGYQITRAKVEAVMACVAVVFAPFILAIALTSTSYALMSAAGITLAAASATQIQLWFRAQAKRSQFRRRHTSSRVATFAEAFSSISWAATGALAAAGTGFAAATATIGVGVLLGAWMMRPPQS
jgi:ABC-2 type transport system permease protein